LRDIHERPHRTENRRPAALCDGTIAGLGSSPRRACADRWNALSAAATARGRCGFGRHRGVGTPSRCFRMTTRPRCSRRQRAEQPRPRYQNVAKKTSPPQVVLIKAPMWRCTAGGLTGRTGRALGLSEGGPARGDKVAGPATMSPTKTGWLNTTSHGKDRDASEGRGIPSRIQLYSRKLPSTAERRDQTSALIGVLQFDRREGEMLTQRGQEEVARARARRYIERTSSQIAGRPNPAAPLRAAGFLNRTRPPPEAV